MNVTENGVCVPDVISAVKRAISAAGVSATAPDRDLQISTVSLTLHTFTVRSSGGGLTFRVPVIGMEIQFGTKLTKHNFHEIQIHLSPPEKDDSTEIRDGGLDDALTEAIATVRLTVASANGGDDPFVLTDSTVTISFGITAEGSISVGVNGNLTDELTHTLVLTLEPTQKHITSEPKKAAPKWRK